MKNNNNKLMAAFFVMLLVITMLSLIIINKLDTGCHITYLHSEGFTNEEDNDEL